MVATSAFGPKQTCAGAPIDETFDVGVDTRTPVDDKDYQVPFRFTGKLDKLTFKLGPTQLTSDDHQVIQRNLANARD
jgi:arylsulfatase